MTSPKTVEEVLQKLQEMKALDEASAKLTKEIEALDRESAKLNGDIIGLLRGNTIDREPDANPKPETCNCVCNKLVQGATTLTHSVLLGIASARDVGALRPAQLAILDEGLTAMALRLIPLSSGSALGAAAEWRNLHNLFSSASLPVVYPVATPSGTSSTRTEFRNFRDHRRNRTQRLNDGVVAWRSEGTENETRGRLVYETLYQLIQFRGILLA